jgi:RHS repeat-associated protein
LDSYGQDPRRIAYAGSEVDGANIDFASKYREAQETLKDQYSDFEVPYNGKDNDDYVNGGGFCCDDAPQLRAGAIGNGNDNPETFQYYYHSDHLGSTSLITNLDGETVQHVEYVPFGEVFIEERNNTWNTPYLFNAKELDEETGLYYYGARYYDSRVSVWLGIDPMGEKYPDMSILKSASK